MPVSVTSPCVHYTLYIIQSTEDPEPCFEYFVYWSAVTNIAKSENRLFSASKAKIYPIYLNWAIRGYE